MLSRPRGHGAWQAIAITIRADRRFCRVRVRDSDRSCLTTMLTVRRSILVEARAGCRTNSHRWTYRQKSTMAASPAEENDPVPSQPTWSVHELLSSYPRPSISPTTFEKLHHLSALIPPEEGSDEHMRLKHELEEMVRLVDAVRLVDTSSVATEDGIIPDGRVRPEEEGIMLASNSREMEFEDPETESGTQLLKHASRTKNGCYVVEAERRRK